MARERGHAARKVPSPDAITQGVRAAAALCPFQRDHSPHVAARRKDLRHRVSR